MNFLNFAAQFRNLGSKDATLVDREIVTPEEAERYWNIILRIEPATGPAAKIRMTKRGGCPAFEIRALCSGCD
jgi:hypothetical protein